ncbi:uncharacterized protein ACIB01_013456 isoform 4-T4 [Guaruba guarouba]
MGPELWRCLHFPWQGNGDSAWKEFSCCLPPCSLTLPQLATSHCRLLRSRSWTPCCFLFFASPPPPRVAAGAAPWRERHQLSPILALCPGSAGSLHPTDPPVPQRPTCTPRSPQVALKDWDICDPLLPGQVGPREPRPVPPPTLPIPDGAIPRCPPRCSSAGC